ncbi:MAG: NnrS family protein [Epsilonproteobacteria bacterium]|nr:NnrS family protein [Campylobacterota bacterium]NPA57567.1 NnrS family protein [Campylobacterota bacterium]
MEQRERQGKGLLYLLSQPHQPFFLLGMVNAILFMVLFIPIYRGAIEFEPKLFHAYSMIFLVFTNFFFGFLYTTFPRFSGTPPIEPKSYLSVLLLQLVATLSFLATPFLYPAIYGAVLSVAFAFTLTLKLFYSIYRECSLPKRDQYWIIVALGIGWISNLLFLFYSIPCSCDKGVVYLVAKNFGFYCYLIFLALVVALRMVPFFSHVMEWKRTRWLETAFLGLMVAHSFLESSYPKALFLPDLLAALLLARELRAIRLPRSREPLLWVLHLALYWLALGLLVGSVISFFEGFFGWYSFSLPLHLVALGFLTTILIGFGTRVVLGHSGNLLRVDKGGVLIFYFTQVVLVGRILFSLAASFGKVSPSFDISATLWILLFLAWLFKYGAVLATGKRI